MKNFEINNVITFKGYIHYIKEMWQDGAMVINNGNGEEEIIIDKQSEFVGDCAMSDWLLDHIFKRHYYNERDWYWVVDSLVSEGLDIPYFKIENCGEGEDCYSLIRGNSEIFYFDNIRELQNAYHFYSDYEDGDYMNEDIDEKIKKLLKLI